MAVRFTKKEKRDEYLRSLKKAPTVVPSTPAETPRRARPKPAQRKAS